MFEYLEATTNPTDFCANNPSPYECTEDDDDGAGWEDDTYLLSYN